MPRLLPATDPRPSCDVEAMVELMTVRLAELVNAIGNLQARLRLVIYAVPVCKKERPNCSGPSEEGKRPAGDDGRSHSKASKPLRCCDTRHCGRHGTS